MTSLKQIDANRRNALKSTGPATPEGKERSRCNAVRHGLTAETVITGLEDADDYNGFEAAVTADYSAETAVERELVLRLASLLWRLRRATKIETAIFESLPPTTEKPPIYNDGPVHIGVADGPQSYKSFLAGPQSPVTMVAVGDGKRQIGDYFLRLATLPTFPIDRLSRYESMLWRQARQIVFTLNSPRRRSYSQRRPPFSFGMTAK